MTIAPNLGRIAAILRDAMVLGTALSMVLGMAASILWLAFADIAVERLRSLLELDRLASAEDLQELAADVRALAGEDRVIRQPRGRSYVEEPVHLGERVVLILFLERTSTGASCEFLSGNSVYEDMGGIRTGGSGIRPTLQVGNDAQRLRVILDAPETLRPGRVTVSLILRYRCGERIVFDETDPIAYRLLAGPAP